MTMSYIQSFMYSQFWLTIDKLKIGQADCSDHTEHDGKNASDDRCWNGDKERPHF